MERIDKVISNQTEYSRKDIKKIVMQKTDCFKTAFINKFLKFFM